VFAIRRRQCLMDGAYAQVHVCFVLFVLPACNSGTPSRLSPIVMDVDALPRGTGAATVRTPARVAAEAAATAAEAAAMAAVAAAATVEGASDLRWRAVTLRVLAPTLRCKPVQLPPAGQHGRRSAFIFLRLPADFPARLRWGAAADVADTPG